MMNAENILHETAPQLKDYTTHESVRSGGGGEVDQDEERTRISWCTSRDADILQH